MPLYNLCFSVCDTIEADDENKALEIFADYIKDMRFGEICDNTEVREAKENEDKQDEQIRLNRVCSYCGAVQPVAEPCDSIICYYCGAMLEKNNEWIKNFALPVLRRRYER